MGSTDSVGSRANRHRGRVERIVEAVTERGYAAAEMAEQVIDEAIAERVLRLAHYIETECNGREPRHNRMAEAALYAGGELGLRYDDRTIERPCGRHGCGPCMLAGNVREYAADLVDDVATVEVHPDIARLEAQVRRRDDRIAALEAQADRIAAVVSGEAPPAPAVSTDSDCDDQDNTKPGNGVCGATVAAGTA